MTVVKRQFYKNHKPNGDEYMFHLARDSESGEVFVIRQADYTVDVAARKP